MKQKNKTYYCNGNQIADNLLYSLESTSVLSNDFKMRIFNLISVILTNLEDNEDWVNESILELKTDMKRMSIFSDDFINTLNSELLLMVIKQKELNNETI